MRYVTSAGILWQGGGSGPGCYCSYSDVAFKLKFRTRASAGAYKRAGISNASVVPGRLTTKYLLGSHKTCNYVCALCSN